MTIYYLAPLNKLGNLAFRKICLNNNADFVFSEMVRIDKLLEDDEVQLKKINIPIEDQSKTIIQIMSEDMDLIGKGVEKIIKLNPKLKEINYNMGCPQSSLCKAENGGGIIKNPQKIDKVCQKLSEVCQKYNILASIKTRIGVTRENINIYENIKIIEKNGIRKIYLHGRVLNDSYSKPATYDEIGQVILKFPELEIIGNGDIKDINSSDKLIEIGCESMMIGRAALENPEIFNILKDDDKNNKNLNLNSDINEKSGVEIESKKNIILEYLQYAKKYFLTISHIKTNISYMTKNVIDGGKIRKDINNIKNIKEIEKYFENI